MRCLMTIVAELVFPIITRAMALSNLAMSRMDELMAALHAEAQGTRTENQALRNTAEIIRAESEMLREQSERLRRREGEDDDRVA